MRISTLLAAIGLIALAAPPVQADTGRALTVTFQQPAAGGTVNEALSIRVSISTSFDLAEVRAVVEDRETLLSTGTTSTGTLDLTGLASGPKTVTVTVTDVFGTTATAQRAFVLDRPPSLTVASPGPASVTRGAVNVSATCTDAEGSCYLTAVYQGATLLQGSGSIQGTIEVSGGDTGSASIAITASDARNQQVTQNRTVYLETNLNWTEALTAPGLIADIDEDAVLYVSPYEYGVPQRLGVLDRQAGTSTEVTFEPYRIITNPQLTPDGAIFAGPNTLGTDGGVYYWDQGVLTRLEEIAWEETLVASEHYATWNAVGYGVALLSFSDDSIRQIDHVTSHATDQHPPSDEGVVVYNYSSSQSRIVSGGGEAVFLPAPVYSVRHDDGDVYYLNSDETQLWVYDGTTHTLLASGLNSQSTYTVNDGWVAYTRPGNLNQQHVWLIAPDHTERQITFFASRSYLLAVGATGEVMFTNASHEYLATPSGVLTDLGALTGTMRWIDGAWYRIRGSSLLKYAPLVVANEPEGPGAGVAAERLGAAPNPVSARARITFELPRAATVRLTVIDVLGREVATLADGRYEAGSHAVAWEADGVHDGVYTLLMQTPTATLTRPLTVAR